MKRFRTLIFWAHLVTAVPAALVILLMSATGVLLTYQRQMQTWADLRGMDASPPAAGAPRLAPDVLVSRVTAQVEGRPTALAWMAGAEAPARVSFGRGRTVYANAYTGAVLGEGAAGMRAFFRKVTDLHRWLGAGEDGRERGKAVTGAANLMFLFLVVSGLYLWFPRNRAGAALRNVTWFRRGLPAKARDFNWHNVVGFWSFVPLFVIVLSGVVISYRWAGDLVYRAVGDTPPPREGGGGAQAGRGGGPAAEPEELPLDVLLAGTGPLLARAEAQVDGWRTISLSIPEAVEEELSFSIDRGTGGEPQKRGTLTLSRATGEVVEWETFGALAPGRQARSILRFAHTGEVLGVIGQTIAGIVSAGAVLLVWTGLALSWRRWRAWRARKRNPPAARPAPRPTESVPA